MAIPGGFFGKFFGRTISDAAGYGVGGALTRPLDPLLQELTNTTWRAGVAAGVAQPLGPGDTADVVAEDEELLGWAEDQAAQAGYSPSQVDAIVRTARNAPTLGMLYEAWRRDLISDADFVHGLRKGRLETRWDSALRSLKQRLLSIADLANARQQGFVSAARQRQESELQGLDNERADILFELSGLPPGIEMGLSLLRRGIIGDAEFAQIVREGHTKTKYTDELLALRHQVLSAAEYATLHLKGWITVAEMNAGGALTGYTPEQMNQLYLARGRPTSPTQGWNAWARDAPGPRGGQFEKDDFLRAIQQSDIRPEYGETLWGLRFNYPSLFQLRRAVQDGSIDPARARRILHMQRYEDQDADGLIESWTRTTAAGVKALTASTLLAEYEGGFMDAGTFTSRLTALGYSAAEAGLYAELGDARRVKSARDSTLSTIRARYVAHKLTRDEMVAHLAATDVAGEAQARLVVEWDNAREATMEQLSASEITRAYKRGVFTRERALVMLQERGWRTDQAETKLDMPMR